MSINSSDPQYIEHLFIKEKLYHSLTKDFNDPFEGKPNFNIDGKLNNARTIRKHFVKIARDIGDMSRKEAETFASEQMANPTLIRETISHATRETFNVLRITCFTTSKDNLLFWSHYANSHKGFCIEFDSNIHPISMAYKVKYSDQFPQVEYPTPKDARAFKPALVKSTAWEYEDEYRTIFLPSVSPKLNDDGESLPLPLDTITNVYLGAKISQEDEATLLRIIKLSRFTPTIWKASLSKNSFNLCFSEVKMDQS
ncbi:DUF2971 domain-containing protein [Vibrio mediterranei]